MTEFGRVITQNEHNLHNGNFQFIESAAQILRRNKQRIAFREKRTIYIENPLKSYDFSGFSGPSDWFRTSGLVVPNRNRKLFSDVSNGFLSFPLVFRYSRDLFGTSISACSARVCSNPCGQKTLPAQKNASRSKERFPLKRTGSVFYVQGVCIVTLGRGLCKWFLRGSNSKLEPL